MKTPWLVAIGSLALAVGLVALLQWQSRTARPDRGAVEKPLIVFCAAGIKPPVEAVAHEYEQEFGVRVTSWPSLSKAECKALLDASASRCK